MELTNTQWEIISPYIPENDLFQPHKGRPRTDARPIIEGILWILRTGAPWKDLPERFPPYQTCHRRYQEWVQNGVLEKILKALAKDLEERGEIDLREVFIDGSLVAAKKGGLALAKLSEEKVPKSWRWRTVTVFLSPYPQEVLRRMK
jgi:transposase